MSDRPECCNSPMAIKSRTPDGRPRYKCRHCGVSTTNSGDSKPGYDVEYVAARMKALRKLIREKEVKRFVVTSAQNNTPINKNFLRALESYCGRNHGELIVIPIHYKNVTAYTAAQEYEKFWAPEVEKYLVDDAIRLNNSIVVKADISIPATMFNPLAGKEPIEGQRSAIFGHPQFAMESVASPIGSKPKRLYTTGAVTKKNYSRSNAGAKAEFHHVTGALVVEVQGSRFWVRQLNADSTGGFYDLETQYTPDGEVRNTGRILALTTGDEHVKFIKPSVRRATYDSSEGLVATLQPRFIVRHDILDGYSGSHHHDHDDVLKFAKFHHKDDDYRAELDEVVQFLNETTPDDTTNVIVASNHHDHLYKWLSKVDPREDHRNALLIHELKQRQYENALVGKTTDPFEIYCDGRLTCDTRFLQRTESFILKGVKYDQHGDVGPNGSRGSAQSLAKSTYKMVIGHSHVARIVKSVYQVGTSTGDLEYQKGLGAHSNTHCIQYPNGKRTLIDIIDGKWRLQE